MCSALRASAITCFSKSDRTSPTSNTARPTERSQDKAIRCENDAFRLSTASCTTLPMYRSFFQTATSALMLTLRGHRAVARILSLLWQPELIISMVLPIHRGSSALHGASRDRRGGRPACLMPILLTSFLRASAMVVGTLRWKYAALCLPNRSGW